MFWDSLFIFMLKKISIIVERTSGCVPPGLGLFYSQGWVFVGADNEVWTVVLPPVGSTMSPVQKSWQYKVVFR